MNLLTPVPWLNAHRQFDFLDHFLTYTDAQMWTKTAGDAGSSVAIDGDGEGGIVDLTTGGTDNNEAYLESTQELFLFDANRAFEIEARVKFTEANTDDANVIFGVADAPGANTLVDDGAGPKASYSGAVFFKVDGGTKWQVESSIGATQITHTTNVTAGGSWQRLRIKYTPITSARGVIVFLIDGAQCRTSPTGGEIQTLIKHEFAFSGATQMAAFAGVKAGGANSEVLSIDYIAFSGLI